MSKMRELLEVYRYGINPCGYPIYGEEFKKLEKSHTNQILRYISTHLKGEIENSKFIDTHEHGTHQRIKEDSYNTALERAIQIIERECK